MTGRRTHRAGNAALAALVVVPWFLGAAWLTARAVAWASPHIARSDGLVLVICLSALALALVLLWPMSDPDIRATRQALAARTALNARAATRRPTWHHRPRETR